MACFFLDGCYACDTCEGVSALVLECVFGSVGHFELVKCKPLLYFLVANAGPRMEHADGSFIDHLQFCYEYSFSHFKDHSPRVLFLHSILGVGTNFFPMKVEKIPKLQSFLTEEEFKHIEAFPSILRLMFHFDFIQELENTGAAKVGETFNGLKFHRVIDNKSLFLDAESFWVQMNYQLMHLLDFLPIADWSTR
ncbi:unnamed protein product, partial [Effrenium voratum]